MDVLAKLQVRPGSRFAVLAAPEDSPVPGDAVAPEAADAVLLFVRRRADLDRAEPLLAAARADRLAWVAYPKAGRLGTDLNRDRLAEALTALGVRPVRQVALDGTWSALRVRPAV